MGKFFGSVSVEDTQKQLAKKFGKRDASESARVKANSLLRGDKSDIQPRAKAAVQTVAKKKPKIIKIDPNVKPITPTLGPLGIVTSIKDAFVSARKKAGAAAAAGKKAVASVPGKVRAAAERENAARDGKTVVPLKVKRPSIFTKPTGDSVKVVPQQGFEKLADEQGVPQVQTFNQARGIKPGDAGPLRNALNKRRAAKAREVNLGGNRSDRSRGGRVRPTRQDNG